MQDASHRSPISISCCQLASNSLPTCQAKTEPTLGVDLQTAAEPLSKSVQCSATTSKGKRCKRLTYSPNGLCHLHGGEEVPRVKDRVKDKVAAKQCAATKQKGGQCTRMTTHPSGFCHYHRD